MPETKKEVMIRVEPSYWRRVKELAKQDDCSAAEYVRRLIRRSLAQRDGA